MHKNDLNHVTSFYNVFCRSVDDISTKHRPGSLNVSRLTNGTSPKVSSLSTEVKLRNSNQSNRNNTNRSSTLQEDLIRLISPEYISGSSSDNGIDTPEEIPDSEPTSVTSFHGPPTTNGAQQNSGRLTANSGAEPPSSELYSMRLSAIGSSSPKYINPPNSHSQRQSWSTTDSDDRKSYQHSQGSVTLEPELPTNGFRSKSPLKQSFSATLYSEPRTPVGAPIQNGTSFRVTPSVTVGHWVKDEMKTPSS